MAKLVKHARIAGADRTKLAGKVSDQYTQGASIRALAHKHGRSYGFIYSLLTENDTPLRPRGGTMRRPADT